MVTKWNFWHNMRAKGITPLECCRVLSNFSGLNVTAKGDDERKNKLSSYL